MIFPRFLAKGNIQNHSHPSLCFWDFSRGKIVFLPGLEIFLDRSKDNKAKKIGFEIFPLFFEFLCLFQVSAFNQHIRKQFLDKDRGADVTMMHWLGWNAIFEVF